MTQPRRKQARRTRAVDLIDVSAYQEAISWDRVAQSGVERAYIKASEGTTHTDAFYAINIAEAADQGLSVGAYHFLTPLSDPRTQASHFLSLHGPWSASSLPPAVDVEPSLDAQGRDRWLQIPPADRPRFVALWIREVEQRLGVAPLIYTTVSFWRDVMDNAEASEGITFGNYALWVAHYTNQAAPPLPRPWRDWAIWQYSDQGRVPGIRGNVDLNRLGSTALPKATRNTETGDTRPLVVLSNEGPAWLDLARGELGTTEVSGPESNPRITEYLRSVRVAPRDEVDETAWCSAFVNWVMEQTGRRGTRNAMARSWSSWGTRLTDPKLGAIAVLWRESPRSPKGHVAFYLRHEGPHVLLLGGNQDNQVCITSYPANRVLSYRWPNAARAPR